MTGGEPLLCGVELGGTKCVCVLGRSPEDIRERIALPTGEDPGASLTRIAQILEDWRLRHGAFDALGLASFGPLELRRDAAHYGRILATPKPGWSGVDVRGFFGARFAMPVGFTTDVIAAALAEGRWGAARGLTDYLYITVGTGVGVGVIAGGRPLIGTRHPEAGHLRVARLGADTWPGACRFHGDCVEGLISGPAIAARSGVAAAQLPADSPVWEAVAHGLAQLLHNLVLTLAPQRILIGGGVASAGPQLFARVRARLRESLNGYVQLDTPAPLEQFVVPPGLGTLAGPLGALAVAEDAHRQRP